MKITEVTTRVLRVPYMRPHKLSFGPVAEAELIIVRVRTDEGIEGYGEASILGGPFWNEESTASVTGVINRYLTPLVMGMNPLSPALIADKMAKGVNQNPFSRAAIEMACFDIAGKALSVSAATLLGGRRRERIPMIWSLAAGDAQVEIDEAEAMRERLGVRILKVKTGSKPAMSELGRITALCKGLGDRFEIRLDSNQGWDEMGAMQILPALRDLGVAVLEQPIPKWNLGGMARLRAAGMVGIMADEGVMDPYDVMNHARAGAADLIALKVAKAGGLLSTMRSSSIAEAAGIACYMGCMMESSIGTSAYLQSCASLPSLSHGCCLPGPIMLGCETITAPLVYEGGDVLVPDGPGMGFEVDWKAMDKFAID